MATENTGCYFEFDVVPDDAEPYRVEVMARDVLVWERTAKSKRSLADLLRGDLHMDDMYHLAWIVSRRRGLYPGEFKAFCESTDVNGAPTPAEDPTPPDQSNEP